LGWFWLFSLTIAAAQDSGYSRPYRTVSADETSDSTPVPLATTVAISFNAVPVLNLALNAVNIAADTGQSAEGVVDFPAGFSQVLVGKYFLTSQTAVRFYLAPSIVSTSTATDYPNPIDLADSTVEEENVELVSDLTDTMAFDVVLGAAYEQRRGQGKLYGVYGAGAFVGFAGARSSTVYGWEYNNSAFTAGVIGDGSERNLRTRYGRTLRLGVRAFAGIEYFVMSQISLSAEYGVSVARSKTGRGYVESERWDVNEEGVGNHSSTSNEAGGQDGVVALAVDSGVDAAMQSSTGALMLNFHF
jgi:hypothetical protein